MTDVPKPPSFVTQAISNVQTALDAKRKKTQIVDTSHLIREERKAEQQKLSDDYIIRNMVHTFRMMLTTYDSYASMEEYDARVYSPEQARKHQQDFVIGMQKAYADAHQRDKTFFDFLYCISLASMETLEGAAKGNVELTEKLRLAKESHQTTLRTLARFQNEGLPPPKHVSKPIHSSGYGLQEDTQHAIDSFKRSGEMLCRKKIEEGTIGATATKRPAFTPEARHGETVVSKRRQEPPPLPKTQPATPLDTESGD